jgi:hypothetical protein
MVVTVIVTAVFTSQWHSYESMPGRILCKLLSEKKHSSIFISVWSQSLVLRAIPSIVAGILRVSIQKKKVKLLQSTMRKQE